jgi:uncharacterized RDD family membrane protein YckC
MTSFSHGTGGAWTNREPAYASWALRVAAALLDGAAVLVLFIVMIGIGAALESTAFSALAFVMIPLYYTLGHGSASGQTWGKKACSIAVRGAEDFDEIGYGRALWRFVIQTLLGWIPIVAIVDVLAPLWSKRNQAWHDIGASTVVVRA